MLSRRLPILMLVFLALFTSPSWPQTPAETSPSAPPVIHALRIRGNRTIPRRELFQEMITPRPHFFRWKPPPIFQPEVLAEDVERLRDAYRRAGFYHAEIIPEVSDELGAVTITLHVQEGPWIQVRHLEVSVVAAPQLQVALGDFLKKSPLSKGERFTEKGFDALKKEIVGYLMDRGYPKARVEGEVLIQPEDNTAAIYLQVWPGPFATFGPIRIMGQQATPEPLIRRALRVHTGEPFSLAKIIATQERLFEMDLFRSVNVTPEEVPPEQTDIPVVVDVTERKQRSLKLGAGYGSWDQFRARAVLRYRNLGGGGRILEMGAKYSRLDTRLEGSFLNPMLLGSPVDLVANAGFLHRSYPSFSDRAFHSRTLLEREVAARTKVYLGHGLEFARPFGITDLALQLLRETESGKLYTVNMLLWGLTRDTVDNPADPQKGGQYFLLGEFAPDVISPQVQFVQSTIEARRYQNLGPKNVVLAGRVKFGLMPPIQGTAQIPIFRRFFAGGPGSMRAYRLYYLGPRDPAGNPLGGESVFLTNLELRFPIYRDFRGVTFVDAGNVFYKLKNTDLGRIKYGAGFGLRYQTPIGPIGLELAWPLNPINRQKDTYQLIFNIGHSF
ncbi:MAG: BamA/OMP85 family outer membrane protein [Desulfobacca sp.]|uniref:BamA/OMP85 family outer membrane protein n=1 Tax=Desulfobacca sp. TaxID=2067990 RepID=UPI00404965C0